jgi:hypothetical protein
MSLGTYVAALSFPEHPSGSLSPIKTHITSKTNRTEQYQPHHCIMSFRLYGRPMRCIVIGSRPKQLSVRSLEGEVALP